MIIDDVRVVVF